jgi:hypothetical protein
MKKISFIIVLALGLIACEKTENGPAIEREDSKSGTEVLLETANAFPEELPVLPESGNDAIENPEKPGAGTTKGDGKGEN